MDLKSKARCCLFQLAHATVGVDTGTRLETSEQRVAFGVVVVVVVVVAPLWIAAG